MRKRDNTYHEPWDRDFYETGSTKPPKEQGGLIAFLLIVVVLLGGFASMMGIVNIHLLRQLAAGETEPDRLQLFEEEVVGNALREVVIPVDENGEPQLGMECQTVSDFDRRFYELPQGVLVTQVTAGSWAEQAGLRSGDVIVALGEQSVDSREKLPDLLGQCQPGRKIRLHFYRQQTKEKLSVNITISDEVRE